MGKSEAYSWRTSPEVKSASEKAEQSRLHDAAQECFGAMEDGDPYLAEQAGERVRRLIRNRGRL